MFDWLLFLQLRSIANLRLTPSRMEFVILVLYHWDCVVATHVVAESCCHFLTLSYQPNYAQCI